MKFSRRKYHRVLKSLRWQKLKKRLIAERGRICQLCLEPKRYLDLHHTHYRTLGAETGAELLLLCRACHKAVHKIKRVRRKK